MPDERKRAPGGGRKRLPDKEKRQPHTVYYNAEEGRLIEKIGGLARFFRWALDLLKKEKGDG